MPKIIWFPPNKIKKLKINRAGVSAFKNLDRYNWILFTSKNTVKFFMDELRTRRIKMPASVNVAAVGPETARFLKLAGFRVRLMPKQFSTDSLVEALVKKLGSNNVGQRILFPRSAIASTDAIKVLRKSTAYVDVVHMYTSMPPNIPQNIISAMKKGTIKYIAFTSPSAVNFFMKKMKGNISDTSAVCIGPSTAHAARAFPFKKIIISKVSTKAGMRALLRTLP